MKPIKKNRKPKAKEIRKILDEVPKDLDFSSHILLSALLGTPFL